MTSTVQSMRLGNVALAMAMAFAVPFGLSACATMTAGPGAGTAGPVANESTSIADPAAKPGIPTLFLAMPNAPDFVAVRKALVSEVQKNFNLNTFIVTADTQDAAFATALERANPVCVVLMNNSTVNLFRRYESNHPRPKPLPTVVVMTSFLEELQSKLKHATGIAYEVPGVTAFVNLRSVITTTVARVGVIYRPAFHGFIERQRALAAKESIELVPVSVPSDVSAAAIRDTLHTMIKSSRIDAIWMLNDNGLLRDGSFLDEAWRSELTESKMPLIVGVPNLVNPISPLGTLAVVPDHEALGLQTANLLFDLAENDWDIASHPVELPLSVKTIVDVRGVRANFGLRDDALRHIDRALE
jgi:hypothetical protein